MLIPQQEIFYIQQYPMSKKFNQYLGKAGHLTVMSEFLMLGWNVAIPEVDIGDDIFVVQDENGTLRRGSSENFNIYYKKKSLQRTI